MKHQISLVELRFANANHFDLRESIRADEFVKPSFLKVRALFAQIGSDLGKVIAKKLCE